MSAFQPETESGSRTCVVVSYWAGLPVDSLYKLLYRMRKVESGCPFDLLIVCNGGDQRPLTLPRRFDALKPRILNRENTNYNLGAWDHGWRNAPGYDYYLFIQDDCLIKEPDWVYGFERRMDLDPGLGLLGEIERSSGMTWDYVGRMTTKPCAHVGDEWLDINQYILAKFRSHGIPRGELANHIPSIILFTSRNVLEEVGGFRYFGPSKEDAIAAEVAFSREIEALGHRISKVSDIPFHLIGHAEWRPNGAVFGRGPAWRIALREAYWKFKGELKLLLGMRRKSRRLMRCSPAPQADELPC
ncbi:glycosyltransferase family 2 protein [Paludisphaera borealis]|uniref:GT2 family glycosyltransferase n=1 Tax=Paludisphaera borealis TaxID=1387353 RepID=A0A1U7CT88_9BACT|nr:glycosyltransferase family 2 protein [Paludisphaera borealis]APW62157.1 hypothetical protein BSF38_03689 [Paludisphaera borealis]